MLNAIAKIILETAKVTVALTAASTQILTDEDNLSMLKIGAAVVAVISVAATTYFIVTDKPKPIYKSAAAQWERLIEEKTGKEADVTVK